MLQARMSEGDARLYSPNRDVAHCFGGAIDELQQRVTAMKWLALREYLKKHGVTDEELGKAVQALSTFVATATHDKKENMNGTLQRSGWYELSDPAMIAVTSLLGTILMGYFWTGAKESTIGGVGPCLEYQDLQRAGRECHHLMTMPRWKRPWYRLKERVYRIWTALRNA
jgi:hypothetical protein